MTLKTKSVIIGVTDGTTDFAIKIENDSFHLYSEQAKSAIDAQAKAFYEYLAEEARMHFDRLMLNHESLSAAGAWAD